MGYMQDTDFKIQDTAYMPGRKIQDTETGYSVYSIEDAGHKVQDTGCSVQCTEYTRLDLIQGIRTKGLKTTLYRIQDQDHSVQNTRYRVP
jgi:hypothetical protein